MERKQCPCKCSLRVPKNLIMSVNRWRNRWTICTTSQRRRQSRAAREEFKYGCIHADQNKITVFEMHARIIPYSEEGRAGPKNRAKLGTKLSEEGEEEIENESVLDSEFHSDWEISRSWEHSLWPSARHGDKLSHTSSYARQPRDKHYARDLMTHNVSKKVTRFRKSFASTPFYILSLSLESPVTVFFDFVRHNGNTLLSCSVFSFTSEQILTEFIENKRESYRCRYQI